MSSVVVIGDALIDEIRDDRGVREFVGGAALNVAVGLARLGVPSVLVAMVGDDEAGDHIRAYLNDYGVALIATAAPYGSARAVSTRNVYGEPEYEFNEASQRRRIRFDGEVAPAIRDATFVAVSCMALDDTEQVDDLAAVLTETSTPFAIDPNPRSGMMRDVAEFTRGFERLAGRAALVKVGADDAALLYGEGLDALRARLVELGADAVLATEGPAGATLEAGAVTVTAPISALPGRIVDTMGAGDAVFSSMLATLAERRPRDVDEWQSALNAAMDAAAATCRFEGALLRLPSALAELDLDRIGT